MSLYYPSIFATRCHPVFLPGRVLAYPQGIAKGSAIAELLDQAEGSTSLALVARVGVPFLPVRLASG